MFSPWTMCVLKESFHLSVFWHTLLCALSDPSVVHSWRRFWTPINAGRFPDWGPRVVQGVRIYLGGSIGDPWMHSFVRWLACFRRCMSHFVLSFLCKMNHSIRHVSILPQQRNFLVNGARFPELEPAFRSIEELPPLHECWIQLLPGSWFFSRLQHARFVRS